MNLADNIFGPDIGSLKGNSTRRKPKPIKYDIVKIPTKLIEQHKDLTHWMDIIFMNEIPITTGINRTIRYEYLVCLNISSSYELYEVIDKIFRDHNKSGFLINDIHCGR